MIEWIWRVLFVSSILVGALALLLAVWLFMGAGLSGRDPDMCCAQIHERYP